MSLVHSPAAHTQPGADQAVVAPHPFKIGDTVICINSTNRAGCQPMLRVGEQYRVVEVSDNGWMKGVNLDDPRLADGIPHFSANRFRLAAEPDDTQVGMSAANAPKPPAHTAEGEGL